MEDDPRFLEGVDLFNRKDFYAAHDPWESLWLERFGEEKDFIQGLILTAVALHHYANANLTGARSRWRIASGLLEDYPSRYWGLDVEHFRRRMRGVMHRLLTEETPPPFDPAAAPELRRV